MDTQTRTLEKIDKSQCFLKTKVSQVFCKGTNNIHKSEDCFLTWSHSWTLLVHLQEKILRIFCFQKMLWLDNILPSVLVGVGQDYLPSFVLFFSNSACIKALFWWASISSCLFLSSLGFCDKLCSARLLLLAIKTSRYPAIFCTCIHKVQHYHYSIVKQCQILIIK